MLQTGSDQPISALMGNNTDRAAVARALAVMLSSTFTLYQKTLAYHWNVTGAHFTALHKLFEEQYRELQEAGDVIAERIRALDYFPPGTMGEFSALSTVPEDPNPVKKDNLMIESLLQGHEACAAEARTAMDIADKYHDPATSDLMIQRIAVHDKTAWMLRSLLS